MKKAPCRRQGAWDDAPLLELHLIRHEGVAEGSALLAESVRHCQCWPIRTCGPGSGPMSHSLRLQRLLRGTPGVRVQRRTRNG